MGKVAVPGLNDLATTNPKLASEWSKEKNFPLTPKDLTAGSGKAVWWNCKNKHFWQAAPSTRNKGVGCPYCSNQKSLYGYNDLETKFPELAKQWNYKRNDPITPRDVVPGSNKKFWWTCPEGHDYEASTAKRSSKGTGCPYCSNQSLLKGFNDLATTHPNLAQEWSRSKNSNKKPSDVIAGTNTKYWWECSLGHEWMQTPNVRVGGNGCPFCARQQLWTGFNDLETVNPKLASQWDSEKNGIKPSEVMTGAKFLAWWKCDQGHEWQSQLRGRKDGNCSICLNRVLLEGFNDLETKHPELAEQWNTKKNKPLKPSEVLFTNRNIKYWWLCKEGHEWDATLASRKTGNNCPVCSRQLVSAGVNDMATTNPELAASFDLKKNYPITPDQILAGTGKAFWWKCEEGHSWKAASNSRFYGRGCPNCSVGGFDSTKPGWLYFIQSIELRARKIGISNFETKRLETYDSSWSVIATWQSDSGLLIRSIETQILRVIRLEFGLPIFLSQSEMARAGGASETFSIEGVTNDEIIRRISEISSELREGKESLRVSVSKDLGI
jgi:hypothetical protein